jgi:hypothetical protein
MMGMSISDSRWLVRLAARISLAISPIAILVNCSPT